jgi:hypothetical protein
MDFKTQNSEEVQGNVVGVAVDPDHSGIAKETVNPIVKNGAIKKEALNGNGLRSNGKVEPDKVKQAQGLNGSGKSEEAEVKPEAKPLKVGLNLESTLKVVEDLHRKSIQRINLISRIKQLETFEVILSTENDELEENPYQGCKLIIEDDKGRRFTTTTPGLIRLVSQFIFNACHEKLADIEAHIVLPNK